MKVLYIDPLYKKSKVYTHYGGVYAQLSILTTCHLQKTVDVSVAKLFKRCRFRPSAIVFGLGYFSRNFFGKIAGLPQIGIPVVVQLFKPHTHLREKLRFCRGNRVTAILSPDPGYEEYGVLAKCPSYLFPYGCDPTVFKDRGEKKIFDVGFSGALHNAKHYVKGAFVTHDMRHTIQESLRKRSDLNCFLNGSDSITARIADVVEYARIINKSKIWLATPAGFGDITPRYYEIGMSRTMIFTSRIPMAYKSLLVDGHNCVEFRDDLSDFMEKVDFYLQHKAKREQIVDTAYREFHAEHTWKKRAEYLLQLLVNLQKGK